MQRRGLHSFPSPAVVVALVELVLCEELVHLWVAGLLRYAASDPLLDPLCTGIAATHIFHLPQVGGCRGCHTRHS